MSKIPIINQCSLTNYFKTADSEKNYLLFTTKGATKRA